MEESFFKVLLKPSSFCHHQLPPPFVFSAANRKLTSWLQVPFVGCGGIGNSPILKCSKGMAHCAPVNWLMSPERVGIRLASHLLQEISLLSDSSKGIRALQHKLVWSIKVWFWYKMPIHFSIHQLPFVQETSFSVKLLIKVYSSGNRPHNIY